MGRPLTGAMKGALSLPEDVFAGADEIAEMFACETDSSVRALLDTHVLRWAVLEDPRLSPAHREANVEGEVYLSAATVWEIGLKRVLGKLDVPAQIFDIAADAGWLRLLISWVHAEAAAALPPHHADPFDRMLVAQARCEGLRLVSADRRMAACDVALIM